MKRELLAGAVLALQIGNVFAMQNSPESRQFNMQKSFELKILGSQELRTLVLSESEPKSDLQRSTIPQKNPLKCQNPSWQGWVNKVFKLVRFAACELKSKGNAFESTHRAYLNLLSQDNQLDEKLEASKNLETAGAGVRELQKEVDSYMLLLEAIIECDRDTMASDITQARHITLLELFAQRPESCV